MALLVGFVPTSNGIRILLIVRDPTHVAKQLDLSRTGAAARIEGVMFHDIFIGCPASCLSPEAVIPGSVGLHVEAAGHRRSSAGR